MMKHRSPLLLWPMALTLLVAGCAREQAAPQPKAAVPPVDAAATAEERPDLGTYFDKAGVRGSFVLYDANTQHHIRYNPERCRQRFIPASTFKLLNALIALETGVVADAETVLKWDGTVYPTSTWNRDHTLRSAFRDSVVWYFQEVARRVGKERMQRYVDAVGYGNRDLSGKIDSFWLDGALRISQEEQIDFLRRLYRGDLPFSERAMNIVKDIAVVEQADEYTLSGKTGLATMGNTDTGWFVGYVESGSHVYFFATNIEGPKGDGRVPASRMGITTDILQHLQVLPEVCGKCQH